VTSSINVLEAANGVNLLYYDEIVKKPENEKKEKKKAIFA